MSRSMHRRWRKRVSTLVVGAVLLSLLPFGGVTASPSPKLLDSSVYHSIASNLSSNFQTSDYSTSQSKVLIPSKLPNSKDTLSFASSLKQSDSREPSTV